MLLAGCNGFPPDCISSCGPCSSLNGEQQIAYKKACVRPPLDYQIFITPEQVNLPPGDSVQFSYAIAGKDKAKIPDLAWALEDDSAGIITSGGLYIAPEQSPPYEVLHAVVMLNKDNGFAGRVTAAVTIAPGLQQSYFTLKGGGVTEDQSKYSTSADVTATLFAYEAVEFTNGLTTSTEPAQCILGANRPVVPMLNTTLPHEGEFLQCMQFRDADGKTSPVHAESIIYDVTPPVISALTIDGGAAATADDLVTLNITAADALSGVSKIYNAESLADLDAAPVNEFRSAFLVRLSPGTGIKTVYIRLTDHAGNLSATASASIERQ